MINGTPVTYADIKALAKERRRPLHSLVALSPINDPFYISPAREAAAIWFKEQIWDRLNPGSGVHLRRIHYAIISQERRPPNLHGTPYENTFDDWQELSSACREARELGLIDAGLFVDRRAGDPPVIYRPDDEASDASIEIEHDGVAQPPAEIEPELYYTRRPYNFPPLPKLVVLGPDVAKPYVIEIWAEKSTMNDVLVPLAHRLDITLVTGLGELSLTHCHQFVERVLVHGRKARILYISDFDPAGNDMPVSVARKIEFILRRDGHDDVDVRLDPLVLTRQQVEDYELPRVPIKDSDRRKGHFEDRFGEGAVELDALEALYPGELAHLVEEAVDVYRQPTKIAREEIEAATERFEQYADQVRGDVVDDHAEPLAELQAEFEVMQAAIAPHQEALVAIRAEVEERYGARIADAIAAINATVAQFYDHAEAVIDAIADDLEERKPDPEEVDWPEIEDADENDDPLFDSRRSYIDQIDRYKRHQGKPTERRRRNGNGAAP
jgi:hypothetical protein